MSMLQSRMLESRVWKLGATRKQCGYVRSLQIFLVFFKLRLRVQKFREPWRSVFRSFPDGRITKGCGRGVRECFTTPQEEARALVPDVETIPEEIPEVPPARVGGSPPPSLSPMTPEEKGEEHLEGEVVVKEHTKKKPRLHYEVSGLSDRVEKACESMNGLSAAMTKMCQEFQRESSELHEGLKAMGLQGIGNKGMLAAMVAYENTLRDISWQVTGSGKAQSNTSLKAASISLGDKVTSVHQVLKEMSRSSNEHHKASMEQLGS